jgi:hypothetical protein
MKNLLSIILSILIGYYIVEILWGSYSNIIKLRF